MSVSTDWTGPRSLNFEDSFQKSVLRVNASVQRRKLPESSVANTHRTDNEDVVFDHHYTAADLRSIAVHEAGHAVVGARLGLPVISIDIRCGGDGLDGWCKVDYSRARPSGWLTVLMAGWAAEEAITGARMASRPHLGSDEDEIAEALAKVSPGQRQLLVATATQQSKRMVREHRGAIAGLAQVLLETAAMTGTAWDNVNIRVDGERLFEALGGAATAILRNAI